MNNFIEMDYDKWFDTYKPIPNHIDTNASFSDGEYGYMFETYGDELKFIQEADDTLFGLMVMVMMEAPISGLAIVLLIVLDTLLLKGLG